MGGRGSTSMGGKLSRARGESARSYLERIDSRMGELADTMSETAPGHTGYLQGAPWGSASDHDQYVAAYNEHHRLQGERSLVLDEVAKEKHGRAASSDNGKTFVNSDGEATTRYITSPAYERAQRRTERAVLRNMGY